MELALAIARGRDWIPSASRQRRDEGRPSSPTSSRCSRCDEWIACGTRVRRSLTAHCHGKAPSGTDVRMDAHGFEHPAPCWARSSRAPGTAETLLSEANCERTRPGMRGSATAKKWSRAFRASAPSLSATGSSGRPRRLRSESAETHVASPEFGALTPTLTVSGRVPLNGLAARGTEHARHEGMVGRGRRGTGPVGPRTRPGSRLFRLGHRGFLRDGNGGGSPGLSRADPTTEGDRI